MTSAHRSRTLAPLPAAPTADQPASVHDAAANITWRPNVGAWVLTWRALLTAEIAVLIATAITTTQAATSLVAAAMWSVLSAALLLGRERSGATGHVLRSVDLVACVGLILIAPDASVRALLAAYACSTIVSWAAHRPVDAFVAGSACIGVFAGASVVAGATLQELVGTLSLLVFFTMATSGFFTVAHRIGALEIAAEVSRERGRYRRDLHDRLGQALSGMHFEVQAVHAVGLDSDAPARLGSLADGYRDAQRMLKDLVSISDEPMVGTNVASVIRQEARRLGQQAGARVTVETTGDPSRIPAWMRPHVVAVAGECVNNALKNGHAHGVDISIDVTEDLAVLSVTDDGVGFDNPPGTITEKAGHYGLREMAERARICGGEVVIASQVGFGTRARLQVPIPDDAAEDILERDASQLRANVWTLVGALRLLLGAIAIMQLVVAAVHASSRTPLLIITAIVLFDLVLGAACSARIRRRVSDSATLINGYLVAVCALVAASLELGVAPAVLVYAPLALLASGIVAGRRTARTQTLLMFGLISIATIAVAARAPLTDQLVQAMLVHITDIVLIGMTAVQGAKLLDRLETLQIRVRYQALARLRHGLSGRMREQLTTRLEQLERDARALALEPGDRARFAEQTAQIQQRSTELKQRLREIVHTLAEPTTSPHGKAISHV